MAEHFVQLEADEEKDEAVKQELNHLPNRPGLEPGARGGDLRQAPAVIQTGRHHGEHAGDAKLLGRQVGGKRREQ